MAEQIHNHVGASAPRDTEVRLVTVERDVAGLKGDISKLDSTMLTGFKEIGAKLEARGSPNWTAISLIVGAVLTMSGWGFALFGNFQSRTDGALIDLKSTITAGIAEQKQTVANVQSELKAADSTIRAELKEATSNFVARPDLNDKFATAKEKRDAAQAATDARINRVETDVAEAKKTIVPIEVHKEQWKNQDYVNNRLQAQIDSLTKKSDDLFNGRDEIQRLVHRLDKLDDIAGRGK